MSTGGDGEEDADLVRFSSSPDLHFDDALKVLLSLTEVPPGRPDLASKIPSRSDGVADAVIAFVREETQVAKQQSPLVASMVTSCDLSDDDLCALVCISVEDPYPVSRWLNGWLQCTCLLDLAVQAKVGPLFKLIRRAMDKLPRVTKRAWRAVTVNNIPALEHAFENYTATMLREGMEVSFLEFAFFSTPRDALRLDETSADVAVDVNVPTIVYVCAALECVDLEPFCGRSVEDPAHCVLPLCPAVFKIHVASRIDQRVVVTVVHTTDQLACAFPSLTPRGLNEHFKPEPAAGSSREEMREPKSALLSWCEDLAKEMLNTKRDQLPRSLGITRLSNGLSWNETAMMLIDVPPPGNMHVKCVGYWALGLTLRRSQLVLSADGDAFNQQQCYVEAIECDKHFSRVYVDLANILVAGESVALKDGTMLSRQGCLLEAIDCDKRCARAYSALGCMLQLGESVTLKDSSTLSQQECFVRAIDCDEANSKYVFSLGSTLQVGESVTLKDGRTMNKLDCFMEAVARDSNYSKAYYHLGSTLKSEQCVTLKGGRTLSKIECYIKSIDCDVQYAKAYFMLGCTLKSEESVMLKDGRKLMKQECYAEAVNWNNRFAKAYLSLGSHLGSRDSVTLKDGRTLSKLDCYVEAIDCDGHHSAAFIKLGNILGQRNVVQLKDGRTLSKYACYVEAVECKCKGSDILSRQRCFVEAIQRDRGDSYAYYCLGNVVPRGEHVTLNDGRMLSKRECFVEALHCNKSNVFAFNGLGNALGAGESATLNDGHQISKRDCYVAAIVRGE